MVFKTLILIFFFSIKISFANIIYDKNEIVITDIEINGYQTLYENNFGTEISKNKSIKNLVLIKKTISFLKKNNPDYISVLDKNIFMEYGNEISKNQILLNFIRFQKIKNEFISEYFINIFSIEDLEIIYAKFDNLEIPVSKNDCLTIEMVYEVGNDKLFIESLFKNLKNKNQRITVLIDDELYFACLNKNLYKNIEFEIIKFIENKTKNDFDEFVYRKIF